MIVVSDTTPLITLMKASRLELLEKLFGTVHIPKAVFDELTANAAFAEEADLIRNSPFIQVVTVHDSARVDLLRRATGLDRGESEAIVYADDVRADLLLMDEVKGRQVARNMGLSITGSVGLLLRSFQMGHITATEARNAFALIQRSGRHISDRLLQDALNLINKP